MIRDEIVVDESDEGLVIDLGTLNNTGTGKPTIARVPTTVCPTICTTRRSAPIPRPSSSIESLILA